MTPNFEKLSEADPAPAPAVHSGAAARVAGWFLVPGRGPVWRRLRRARVALVLAAAGVCVWAGGTAAVFAFVRGQRGIATVRYAQFALPWRWDEYRLARGEHWLGQAQLRAARGQHAEALSLARLGLRDAPAHRAGRLLLAELERGRGRSAEAQTLLREGFAHHRADPVYVGYALRLLLREQADDTVIALARGELARPALGRDVRRLHALAAATASHLRGACDDAEDFLRAVPENMRSREGRLLAAKLEWDRGFRALALVQLRALADEFPQDAEVHRTLVACLGQTGEPGEVRRRHLALLAANPAYVPARLGLLQAYRESGDTAAHAREAAALLREGAGDAGLLLAFAEAAAQAGDLDLLARATAVAAAHAELAEPLALLAIEADVAAGRPAEALARLRALRNEAALAERHRAVLDSFEGLAHLCLGDTGAARVKLAGFLAQRGLRAANLLAVANRCAALGGEELARQVLRRAVELEPQHQAVWARLVELDILLNRVDDLGAHVQRLLGMRRVSPDLLRVAQQKLGSDLFLFSREGAEALTAVQRALEAARLGQRP